jgi:elongation factor Ts
MNISPAMVKELREKTGSGMMDCKNALVQSEGDMEKALDFLREKGLAAAAKRAGRIASEGMVDSYIHGGGRIGVLVEINTETDFAAKNEEFKIFVKDVAMQIAANKPEFVKREEISQDIIDREKKIIRAQAIEEGKPEKIIDKMIDGRIEKYFADVCLMEQPWIKDTDKTIGQLLTEKIVKIGENITIRRFVRFEKGEGIEKKQENFAEEVMKQVNS